MLAPLMLWLRKTNRIGTRTIVVQEFRWLHRRIDLATLSSAGLSTAYELKLRDTLAATEQALMNTHAFNRSYIVTATMPSRKNICLASQIGTGIIYWSPSRIETVLLAPVLPVAGDVRRRIRELFDEHRTPVHV